MPVLRQVTFILSWKVNQEDANQLPESKSYKLDKVMGSSEEVYGYAWETVYIVVKVVTFLLDPYRPDLEHVAIVVYGYVCEFGSHGVATHLVKNGRPKSVCDVKSDARREYLGKTEKTEKEFFVWLQKSKKKYNKETYHVVDCNCIHWAQEAADFLGIKHDPAWRKLRRWLINHRLLVEGGTRVYNASS